MPRKAKIPAAGEPAAFGGEKPPGAAPEEAPAPAAMNIWPPLGLTARGFGSDGFALSRRYVP